MGLLRFYYDKIIVDNLNKLDDEAKNYILNDWSPDSSDISVTNYYIQVENDILQQFGEVLGDKLKEQIWKVVRSLRRINNTPEDISQQFQTLLEINASLPAQRTPDWYAFRENMITASSWGNVLGMVGSVNELLLQKLGYEPAQFNGNEFTVWGTKYEPVATSVYEKREGKEIIEFGCLRHPDKENFFLGASPDGISADGVMLEIKCPPKRKIGPIPTDYYWSQMQGQLEVCNLEKCDFLECKLEEYETKEEYEDDLDLEKMCTKSEGQESGIVLTFKDKEENLHYFYSEFFAHGETQDKWMIDILKKCQKDRWEYVGASYWKIVIYQVNPVFRDREWFAETREKLKQFYDMWQFYKKEGYESLIPKKTKNKHVSCYDGVCNDKGEEVKVKKLTSFGFSSTKAPKKDIPPEKDFEKKKTVKTVKKMGFAFK